MRNKEMQSNISDFGCCREQIGSKKLKATFMCVQIGTYIPFVLPIYTGNEHFW